LFVATCLSTLWVAAVHWKPLAYLEVFHLVLTRQLPQGVLTAAHLQMDWWQGLVYMGFVLAILMTHEMGHFLMTLRYRIPASLPYFIPVPIIPFGTLGAVIGMEGSRANRRELFDLGIAGPLAGLAVAVPVLWVGISRLNAAPVVADSFIFHNPLLVRQMIAWLHPDFPTPGQLSLNQFNPFLMAGWLGMLVTGLNTFPISQFDGGHVAYALLPRRAHLLARALLVAAIVLMLYYDNYFWILVLLLAIFLGTDHPPTADDGCRLGWFRYVIGWASLLLPILCFPLPGITPVGR
jgi:membrane-associated protease RseP (regulator of RpoE activity)